MRHGTTDQTQKDKDRTNLSDCTKQRNLSTEGHKQVKRIGQSIRTLKIPIGNVLSSPYCRCTDTAKLTFGNFTIDPQLQFSISKNQEEAKKLGLHLYSLMQKTKVGKKNAVIVGHSSNLKDGLGVWPRPEAVMAIFQKRGEKLVFKGLIEPNEWP